MDPMIKLGIYKKSWDITRDNKGDVPEETT